MADITSEIRVEDPKRVRVSITMTMTVDDWERMLAAVIPPQSSSWPAWKVAQIIEKGLSAVRRREVFTDEGLEEAHP